MSETKNSVKQNRAEVISEFSHDALRQIMDCGTSISSDYVARGKALGLFNIMKGFAIGYKVEFSDLVNRKWKKWIKGDPTFKASDILTANDVKGAIKAYYLASATGALTFKDGTKRMLQFVMEKIDNTRVKLSLQVVEFKEVFKITEPKAKEEVDPVEASLIKAFDLCNTYIRNEKDPKQKRMREEEKKIITRALDELKVLHEYHIVK